MGLLSFSQSLVVNGGFEDENICTEYQVTCAPEGWISSNAGFSTYIKSPGVSFAGFHCMMVEAGRTRNKYQRTYIRTQLLCGLRSGNSYLFQCHIKSRNKILDSAGVYFTSTDFLFDKTPLHRITPTIYLCQSKDFSGSDTGWQKITFVYMATGNEKYLTIGNFSKRDFNGETGIPLENHFYFFVDDISFTPVDPSEKLCKDWTIMKSDIYDFNDRHEFMERYIRYYRSQNKTAPLPELSLTQMIKADTLVLPDVLFAVGKYNLQKSNNYILDSFCKSLAGRQIDSIVVEGHTDSTGERQLNNVLSLQRASTVAGYITSRILLNASQISSRNWGSLKPVAGNRTPAGRSRNRRVEVLLYLKR